MHGHRPTASRTEAARSRPVRPGTVDDVRRFGIVIAVAIVAASCASSSGVTSIEANVPVGDDAAAFTVLGSIALQGLRLAEPTFGERFVVFGVGLLGLLAVQLLRANGCEVLAVDPNAARLRLAARFGARTVDLGAGADPVASALAWSEGRGVDGVLITASAQGDEIVHQAASSCRKRGRIILVGVVGLNLRRSDFFEKELSFQVSCSYGPGRYDEDYEQAGRDYPFGFVRWTERRNFEAILQALGDGRIDVDPLISHRFAIDDALAAYGAIQGDDSALGVLLEYPEELRVEPRAPVVQRDAPEGRSACVGVIGAGNFAKAVLLPALAASGAQLAYVANRGAAGARHAARKFGAQEAVTDHRRVLDDPRVEAVVIAVGHHAHAGLVAEALEAGKHVFVEKPLALDDEQLARVDAAVRAAPDRLLLVGFNRRFSPHTVEMRRRLIGRGGPLCMAMTINAGEIPADHWTQDPERGGGRIIGEACHFIDLMSCLADAPVTAVSALRVAGGTATRDDKSTIALEFADGSIGSINYFANGPKSYPKETLELFSDGRVLRQENFRVTRGWGFRGFRSFRTRRQDKGHAAELSVFVERVRAGGEAIVPYERLRNVTLASFAAVTAARERRTVRIDDRGDIEA